MKPALHSLFAWCVSIVPAAIHAQSILHYTETSSFDHQTRAASLAMFEDIGTTLGVTVVDDMDGSAFNSLAVLQQFDVIVFSNTSGDAILDPVQRANFEAYIAGGGSLLGIHAASDTYRHSSANGTNTGSWDFYPELLGASVQQAPNHVNGTPLYDLSHVGSHPSTASLPDPWPKEEEYYYWESGYFGPDNIAALMVEETIGPNGLVNSYDAPRPMSWYRELPEGGHVFYTALGHAASNYTTDTLFRGHVRDGLAWMLGIQQGIPSREPPLLQFHPNPADEEIVIAWSDRGTLCSSVTLIDAFGRPLMHVEHAGESLTLDLRSLPDGTYGVVMSRGRGRKCGKLVIQH